MEKISNLHVRNLPVCSLKVLSVSADYCIFDSLWFIQEQQEVFVELIIKAHTWIRN